MISNVKSALTFCAERGDSDLSACVQLLILSALTGQVNQLSVPLKYASKLENSKSDKKSEYRDMSYEDFNNSHDNRAIHSTATTAVARTRASEQAVPAAQAVAVSPAVGPRGSSHSTLRLLRRT